MKRHEWPPSWIRYLRRQVLQENTWMFSRHWVSEDGQGVSRRTVESWEQGLRRPPLYIRQHMSTVLYRLRNRHGMAITMPGETQRE